MYLSDISLFYIISVASLTYQFNVIDTQQIKVFSRYSLVPILGVSHLVSKLDTSN